MFSSSLSLEVDNCPERVDAADAEAPRPPRIETAVEFWSGVEVRMQAAVDNCPKRMQAAVDNCPERMDAAVAEAPTRIETAVEF